VMALVPVVAMVMAVAPVVAMAVAVVTVGTASRKDERWSSCQQAARPLLSFAYFPERVAQE
jgi:hypothetical protein